MNQYALVADLGGTQMRVALVDRVGQMQHWSMAPTDAHTGRDAVVERLVYAFECAISEIRPERPIGVGVSLASPIDAGTGVMHNPPNLPGWDGYSLKSVLGERLSLRVSFGNDAALAAVAEHMHGAGRPYRHMVYMTLSTGIGGGVIIDGRLYTGARGYAGEIGHVTIDRNGPTCNCGNVGCLEAMASGTAHKSVRQRGCCSGRTGGIRGGKIRRRGCRGNSAGGRYKLGDRDRKPASRIRPRGNRHRRRSVAEPRATLAGNEQGDKDALNGAPASKSADREI